MAASPEPPARIRSTSVPCGTISSVIPPAMICFSASESTPGRAEKQVTRFAIWWLSASRCPVGNPGWPRPLQYTVSPREPFSPSAEMSVDGYRCDRPNPATPTLVPSPISATASAAVITFPSPGVLITATVLSAPDLAGGLDQQVELGPLLVDGERVAFHGGREPA